MKQTIEGSVLIYPRAVGGEGNLSWGHIFFQGAEIKISVTKEFKEGLWKIDRQLTANEWGRGHYHSTGSYGGSGKRFFYCFIFFLTTKGSNVEA